jgi:hypothetical protein
MLAQASRSESAEGMPRPLRVLSASGSLVNLWRPKSDRVCGKFDLQIRKIQFLFKKKMKETQLS